MTDHTRRGAAHSHKADTSAAAGAAQGCAASCAPSLRPETDTSAAAGAATAEAAPPAPATCSDAPSGVSDATPTPHPAAPVAARPTVCALVGRSLPGSLAFCTLAAAVAYSWSEARPYLDHLGQGTVFSLYWGMAVATLWPIVCLYIFWAGLKSRFTWRSFAAMGACSSIGIPLSALVYGSPKMAAWSLLIATVSTLLALEPLVRDALGIPPTFLSEKKTRFCDRQPVSAKLVLLLAVSTAGGLFLGFLMLKANFVFQTLVKDTMSLSIPAYERMTNHIYDMYYLILLSRFIDTFLPGQAFLASRAYFVCAFPACCYSMYNFDIENWFTAAFVISAICTEILHVLLGRIKQVEQYHCNATK